MSPFASAARPGRHQPRTASGGGERYVAKAEYGANHVPDCSRWIKIVVK